MEYSKLEELIGYKFNDISLLKTALIHRSYTNEHRGGNLVNNERLEFLGDAVLEIVVSDYLYRTCERQEGDLSKMRASIVCEKALSSWGLDNNLGDYLTLGHGEEISGGKTRPSVLADALEAIFGAIYLDGGFDKVYDIIEKVLISIVKNEEYFIDNKTKLQELAQGKEGVVLSYKILDEYGPDHDKKFEIGVYINNKLFGKGMGTSKKAAQQEAARKAIEHIESNVEIKEFWASISDRS